jgi:hypothetical protein
MMKQPSLPNQMPTTFFCHSCMSPSTTALHRSSCDFSLSQLFEFLRFFSKTNMEASSPTSASSLAHVGFLIPFLRSSEAAIVDGGPILSFPPTIGPFIQSAPSIVDRNLSITLSPSLLINRLP